MVENVCQVIEEKAHGVFANWIKKERHDEEGVIEAEEKEPESINSWRYVVWRFQWWIEAKPLPQHGMLGRKMTAG